MPSTQQLLVPRIQCDCSHYAPYKFPIKKKKKKKKKKKIIIITDKMTSGQNCTKSPEQIKEQMKKKQKKRSIYTKAQKNRGRFYVLTSLKQLNQLE